MNRISEIFKAAKSFGYPTPLHLQKGTEIKDKDLRPVLDFAMRHSPADLPDLLQYAKPSILKHAQKFNPVPKDSRAQVACFLLDLSNIPEDMKQKLYAFAVQQGQSEVLELLKQTFLCADDKHFPMMDRLLTKATAQSVGVEARLLMYLLDVAPHGESVDVKKTAAGYVAVDHASQVVTVFCDDPRQVSFADYNALKETYAFQYCPKSPSERRLGGSKGVKDIHINTRYSFEWN